MRTCSSGLSGAASASGATYKTQRLQALGKQLGTARLTKEVSMRIIAPRCALALQFECSKALG